MKKFRERWAFLYPYIRRHRAAIIWGQLFVVLNIMLDLVAPWMIKIIMDNLKGGLPFASLYRPLGYMTAAMLVNIVMFYYQRRWVIMSSRKIEQKFRDDLYKAFQAQPRVFYDKKPIGDLMSNATNDLDRIRDFMGPIMLHLTRMVCTTIFTLACVFMLHPGLAVAGIIPVFIVPFFANKFLKFMHNLYGKIQKNLSDLNSFVQDSISGIQVIKAYGKNDIFLKSFAAHSSSLKDNSLRVAYYTAGLWPVLGLLSSMGILMVLAYGGKLAITGEITIGTLTAAILYLLKLQFPLIGLGWVANMLQRSNAAVDRLMALNKEFRPVEEASARNTEVNQKSMAKGFDIEVKNLSFAYPGREPVLKDISLTIPSGSSLGIVGPTGSGKTTLMHIICGVYPPPLRVLSLSGHYREDFTDQEWTEWFSLAPQDGFLFSTTIEENINLGRGPQSIYTTDEVGALSAFSRDLPQIEGAYSALLGERGINLSGGQRQRVGVARSLLANAPILCLDDNLSALDMETETIVLQNLEEKFKARTLLIVSHRYSAVKGCDNIIFLNEGRITERGTHQQLIDYNGMYKSVYRKQVISEDLEKS
jgi:ATP-binding cassette subfamily B multidrug efflux pump